MRKPALLILAASTLALIACSPAHQEEDDSSSSSATIDSSEEKTSESAERVALSQETLDVFKKTSLEFKASRKTRYTAYVDLVEEGSEDIYIGKSSYSFKEYSDTTEETIKDVSYYKDSDGKAVTYEINFLNQVSKVIVEGGNLVFDEAFYNPFKDLTLSDFSLGEDGAYSLKEEKRSSFWKPLSFYDESITSVSLLPYSNNTLSISITSEDGSTYETSIDGTLSISVKEDLNPVAPYASEGYHASLQSAYDEVVKANNLTYERSRKPVDEDIDIDEETYESKISKSNPCAVVFSYGGKDTSGIARYDDGNDYLFSVKEGKAIKGESNSIKLPFTIGTVKAEVFEKIDESHFKARTSSIAKSVAGFLMEKLGDALLVDGSAFGDAGCENLILEMTEGKLMGFEYTVTRLTETSGSYLEKNVVKIKNVGTTSIPYEFTTGEKKEEPTFDITPFIGEFEGYNVASSGDDELHTMTIASLDDMVLDGKKLTFHSRVHDESFNAVWGENRYVQIAVSSRYGYVVREAENDSFKSFGIGIRTFNLRLAKKLSALPTLADISFSNGWQFEDDEETEYKIVVSTELTKSKFYVEERVDGSWQYVEKEISEISFNEEEATLSFKANGDTFSMKFYSKEQGIVKNASGSIKAFLSPDSEY